MVEVKEYPFLLVKVEGEWMDFDDALAEYGEDAEDMIEDSFEVKVQAKSWRDAREKIIQAAKALQG